MKFGNNVEKMAFEKGEWPVVEILSGGNVIIMGRPPHRYARLDAPGWIIKRIDILQDIPKPGCQTIEIKYANHPRNMVCWDNRYDYEYLPL